jgi:hypothetical protein
LDARTLVKLAAGARRRLCTTTSKHPQPHLPSLSGKT